MGRDRAAYMREYRKRQKNLSEYEVAMTLTAKPGLTLIADEHLALLNARIAELEEEIRHLKTELAAPLMERYGRVRDIVNSDPISNQYNTRPFTPVPKK